MTGRYIHHIGAWDNATPLPSDTVTWAHLLRGVGYDAVLSGKQHFEGLDQLHGFRAQLARDLHAENDHGIIDWESGTPAANRPWGGLEEAGPGTTTEIEVDDSGRGTGIGLPPRSGPQRPALGTQRLFHRAPLPACGAATILGSVPSQ